MSTVLPVALAVPRLARGTGIPYRLHIRARRARVMFSRVASPFRRSGVCRRVRVKSRDTQRNISDSSFSLFPASSLVVIKRMISSFVAAPPIGAVHGHGTARDSRQRNPQGRNAVEEARPCSGTGEKA